MPSVRQFVRLIEDERTGSLSTFMVLFSKESDRAAVILVAARADYLLEELIRAKLLPHSGKSDELLASDRALGTLSARIEAAVRLGTIDQQIAQALHLLRRMRNDFAHSFDDTTFSDSHHRNRLIELRRVLASAPIYVDLEAEFLKLNDDTPQQHIQFVCCGGFLLAYLAAARVALQPTNAFDSLLFYDRP